LRPPPPVVLLTSLKTTPRHHSRHPNFFAEQALWWTYHLFSYAPAFAAKSRLAPPYAHWTVVGPVLLTLLFQGSTKLTEELSVAKYKQHYRHYIKATSRLVPWFPRGWQD